MSNDQITIDGEAEPMESAAGELVKRDERSVQLQMSLGDSRVRDQLSMDLEES